ncbi:hypothetical protein L6164_001164 [Bauhinia variegata]|uniref:Uncharacterized protein n=1 Tax=Bauhinia variegata TaxID=167791 RepID=A0ACB9QAU2_BAUVA|nr:hypothetical protein L6164_001164 [Bauhinia variegata]
MGLNESFGSIRGHILLMALLPNVNKAYSMLIHEETQRQIASRTVPFSSESAAMSVPSNQNSNLNPPRSNSSKIPNVICNYCKKLGHSKDKCYKLHGFPPDFKFTKRRKFSGSVQSNVSETVIPGTPPAISAKLLRSLLLLLTLQVASVPLLIS